MKKLFIILILLSFTAFAMPTNASAPIKSITSLLTGSADEAKRTVPELATFPVDSLSIWITSFTQYVHPDTTGKFVHITHKINDSLTAPAFLYVPKSYDGSHKTPLVLYLHGGVSRPEYPSVSDSELMTDDLVKICEQNGWFYLFPFAKTGCLWWNDTGMNNLKWLLHEIKQKYAIDDDRVVMCGFSDGGSGSYHMAMIDPTNFAQFFPWSGHMAVGSLDGEMQQTLTNLRARPMFATVGGADQLYPTRRMLPMLELAQQAGARLNVTVYDTATHDDSYLNLEYPAFIPRVEQNYRNPFESTLYWETADIRYGSVDWLTIRALDTARAAASWQQEYNCKLVNDNVTIGFNPEREWKGDGVRVDAVMDDSISVANKIGLKMEDVIVAMDTFHIHSLMDLTKARAMKKRGDSVIVAYLRGPDNRITKKSAFPPIEQYDAFPRKAKSGAVMAHRIGNRFELETSRVKAVSIMLNPAMIRFDQPVTVVVNGKIVFDKMVQKDSYLLLNTFIENRDKTLLWWGKIDISIE